MIRVAATSRRAVGPSGGLIVGCLYLPNGNPAPGPKFDYKLRLFERLTGYSKSFGQRRAGSDLARNRKMLWGGRRGKVATASLHLTDGVAAMPQPNDLSRSLVALDQNSTII